MRLESSTRSRSLAWSNPVSWWWAMLTLVSGVNIAAWILMYRELHHAGSSGRIPGMEVMLLLSAAYVFGCAFRSLLPRADVQRICLFDTWLSSVAVGRSVATVAEICFAAQWTMILL
jgi:phosphatidylglycerophosphate synthase